jgi:hypothetical protein
MIALGWRAAIVLLMLVSVLLQLGSAKRKE